jgi:hypothetical protein
MKTTWRATLRLSCVGLGVFLAFTPGKAQVAPPAARQQDTLRQPPNRDAIGDLNSEAVQAGSFSGAIVLPGTVTSLAIGGFIKTAAILDTRLEQSGSNLLPGTFGSGMGEDGNFALDATLSRLYFDARAPVRRGNIRGYLEWDFNASNNGTLNLGPRLAFGTWDTGRGILLAGHNWSNFMDPKIIPESLTEPTVSGAVFNRQAQIRWTQPFSDGVRVDVSLEDPSASDLYSEEVGLGRTRLPDVVADSEVDLGVKGHLRVGGILRRLESRDGLDDSPSTGWGLTVSGRLNVGTADRVAVNGTVGMGIARYILGNGPRAGGIVDPATGRVHVLGNYGALVSYRHARGERTRSSGAIGSAWAEVLDEQPEDAFRSTRYGFLNLMHSPVPYVTVGAEYAYARYETKDGSVTDNHRLVFGVQIF